MDDTGGSPLTVDAYSLVVLLSAALSLLLALLTVAAGRWSNPTVRSFALYSAATATWAFGHFLQQAMRVGDEPGLLAIGSLGWFVSVVRGTGMIATPIAWFAMCTRVTHRGSFPRALRAPLAVLFVGSLALVATNPATGWVLRARTDGVGVEVRWPEYVMLAAFAALAVAGAWQLVKRGWERGRSRNVLVATLTVAVTLSIVAAIAWVTRAETGAPAGGDLAPLLFPVINVILLYQVLYQGFADIMPVATARAFASMSDLALVIGPGIVVEEMNEAARRELPDVRLGERLDTVMPELAGSVRECMSSDRGHVTFEIAVGGSVFEGRAHLARPAAAAGHTCILMMTDVTDLRRARTQLERARATGDADATTLRTPY